MTTKSEWLAIWGYHEGTEEAERAWSEKQSFMPRRASFSVKTDSIDPVRSMANGKMYDTKSGLYASYRPNGNPQGIRYECVGDDTSMCTDFKSKPRDEKKASEAIERTLGEFGL